MSNNLVYDEPGVLPGELERVIERYRSGGWKELEPDKRAFAISYAQCLSHVEAARAINRPGKGLSYLRDPLVKALVSDMQEEQAKITLINKGFVEQKMLETLEKLEGNQAVPMVTGQGIPIEEKKFHSGEVVGLLKEMGKITGMVPEKQHGGDGGVNIQINLGALLGEDHGITIDHD